MLAQVERLSRLLHSEGSSALLLSLLRLPFIFKKTRDEKSLLSLISAEFFYTKKILKEIVHFPKKRHLFIKFSKINLKYPFGDKQVIGVFILFNILNGREILEERQILEVIRKIEPSAKVVDESYLEFSDAQQQLHGVYLEIEQLQGGFSRLKRLKTVLQEEFKECIKELVPKTFMRRNEEEIYKVIQVLRSQLNAVRDVPQAVIQFDEQTSQDLCFTVIILRVVGNNETPVQEKIEKHLPKNYCFFLHRIAVVGTIGKKYRKEATIFRLGLPKTSFFRKDGSVNLYKARKKVVLLLDKSMGAIRDYNGGFFQKQSEQLDKFLHLMSNANDHFLYENFFYSIQPIEMQAVLSASVIKEWFLLFSKLFDLETSPKSPYQFVYQFENRTHQIAIRSEEASVKNDIISALAHLGIPLRRQIFTEIVREGEFYFGCLIQDFPIENLDQIIREVLEKWTKTLDSERHLRLILQDVEPNLDPRISKEDQSYIILKMLFEGLTRIDENGKPVLALAKSCEVLDDYKRYVFHLRDAKWSNQTLITAYDFEYSWKRALLQTEGLSPFLSPLFLIKNARKIREGILPVEQLGVNALNPKELVVELEYPTPHFFEVAAHSSYSVISKETDQARPGWAYSKFNEYVCNGPFKLHDREPIVVLDKNPAYWDAEKVKLNKISISKLERGQNTVEMLQHGKLDIIGRPMICFPKDGLECPKLDIEQVSYPLQGVFCLCLNTQRPPFNNKKIRQAFAHAIDRRHFETILNHEFDSLRYTLLPSALSFFPDPLFPQLDLEKARSLFHEGMKELGMEKMTLIVSYCNSMQRSALFKGLQDKWKAAFGIEIKQEASKWESHFRRLVHGQFHIGGIELRALWSDPLHFFEYFEKRESPLNFSSWEHPLFQDLLQNGRETLSIPNRNQLLKQAEMFLAEEIPAIPLYQLAGIYLKRRELENVLTSGYFLIDFKNASKHTVSTSFKKEVLK